MSLNAVKVPAECAGTYGRLGATSRGRLGHRPGHRDQSTSAVEDKELHALDLRSDELEKLQVLEPGTRSKQGGVYIDLKDLAAGEFTAMGGQRAGDPHRYVAKRDTDHELWNRLRDQATPNARPGERGAAAAAGIVDQQDALLSEIDARQSDQVTSDRRR